MNTYKPEEIDDEIDRCRTAMDFRPITCVIAATTDNRLLLVKSSKEQKNIWWPVQSGIKNLSPSPETPAVATIRELEEETGIPALEARAVVLGGLRKEGRPKDGYLKGKFLTACGVEIDPTVEEQYLRLNGNEISAIRAVTFREMENVMSSNVFLVPRHAMKAEFVIEHTLRYLSPPS